MDDQKLEDQKSADVLPFTEKGEVKLVFDHGLRVWMQVFGAFWLWFNTW